MKTPPRTPAEWKAHHYWYGMWLGGHGIPFEELAEDWPEVLKISDVMRGWRVATDLNMRRWRARTRS